MYVNPVFGASLATLGKAPMLHTTPKHDVPGPAAVVDVSAEARELARLRKQAQAPMIASSSALPAGDRLPGSEANRAGAASFREDSLNAQVKRGEGVIPDFVDKPLLDRAKALTGFKVQAAADRKFSDSSLGSRIVRHETVFDAGPLARLDPETFKKLGQTLVERARS